MTAIPTPAPRSKGNPVVPEMDFFHLSSGGPGCTAPLPRGEPLAGRPLSAAGKEPRGFGAVLAALPSLPAASEPAPCMSPAALATNFTPCAAFSAKKGLFLSLHLRFLICI